MHHNFLFLEDIRALVPSHVKNCGRDDSSRLRVQLSVYRPSTFSLHRINIFDTLQKPLQNHTCFLQWLIQSTPMKGWRLQYPVTPNLHSIPRAKTDASVCRASNTHAVGGICLIWSTGFILSGEECALLWRNCSLKLGTSVNMDMDLPQIAVIGAQSAGE
jgi:hypothetical protein